MHTMNHKRNSRRTKDKDEERVTENETTKLRPESESELKWKLVISSIQIQNKTEMGEKFKLQRVNAIAECKKRFVTRIKICWAFFSFLVSMADVAVIIVIAYLHFVHAHDVIAWLMLLPILLNFIGIFTFLSNPNERQELEDLAGNCPSSKLVKNLMILPVVGPAISSLRLFIYALNEDNAEKFERLESLLMKMKSYESFFRASPEAFIQMTYRIVNWQNDKPFDSEDRWTSACVMLCVFALAESNFYGVVRPYYRMFTDPAKLPDDAWSVEQINIPWRILLFFYTYSSIISRLVSDAILRATIYFALEEYGYSFGEVIAMTLITQFISRSTVHATLLRPRENLTMEGNKEERNPKAPPITPRTVDYENGPLIYRAFTYSWRSIFMAFDFQNPDRFINAWFFIENFIMVGMAYGIALYIEYDLSEKSIYFVYTGLMLGNMTVAFAIKLSVYCWYNKPYAKSSRITPPLQVLTENN